MTTLRTKQRLASVADWGMSTNEISRTTGVSIPTVRLYRIEAGKQGSPKALALHARAAAYQGWDQPLRVIAVDLDCSLKTALKYRGMFSDVKRRRGCPRGVSRGPCAKVVAFVSTIDWDKTDSELSRAHDISRERFRQLRKQFQKPASPRKGVIMKQREDSSCVRRLREVKDWMRFDYEISQEAGCSVASVSRFRQENNIPHRPRGDMDWSKVDWSKRSCAIARETGKSLELVCLTRRRYAPETVKRRAANANLTDAGTTTP